MNSSSGVTVRGPWRVTPGAEAGLVAESAIHSESQFFSTAAAWDAHSHALHELLWVRAGAITATVDDRLMTVPRGYGLWLPSGVEHAGRLTQGAELSSAFFAPNSSTAELATTTLVSMTPLLDSLLQHLARADLSVSARARAEAVVFDVLEPARLQLWASIPADRRIAAIVEAVIADPGDERSLTAWAAELGWSERTITRVFRAVTGLSFAQWRHSVRIHHSMALLAAGWDVQEVSLTLGYAQPSTFIAAFRRVVGTTPGMFGAHA